MTCTDCGVNLGSGGVQEGDVVLCVPCLHSRQTPKAPPKKITPVLVAAIFITSFVLWFLICSRSQGLSRLNMSLVLMYGAESLVYTVISSIVILRTILFFRHRS